MTDETITVTVELTPEEVEGLRRIAPRGYSDGEPKTPEGGAIRKIFDALPPREPKVGERWSLKRLGRQATVLSEFSTVHGEKCIVAQYQYLDSRIHSVAWFVENAEYLDDGDPDV